MLEVGKKAPSFSLKNQNDELVSLNDFKGQKVVLYFYPKDNTSGCTKEACSFNENISSLNKINAVVLGVSPDSIQSHKKFADKYGLTFNLLSDSEKTLVQAYDVWKEKSMYGKKYMGVERTTIIIDENGKISKIFNKVKVEGHTQQVLDALK
ncbi:MAG: thioredoxin-dependent thiol peroxidase [Ignavibacteriaceae bacterium]|nr:thioredoxin-dependent thiol peroxidase [Ignavibacteriaceae bacterium]